MSWSLSTWWAADEPPPRASRSPVMTTTADAITALEPLRIGDAVLDNRLIHGTGRFPSDAVLAACLRAARPSMVTLAIRRLALDGGRGPESVAQPDHNELAAVEP